MSKTQFRAIFSNANTANVALNELTTNGVSRSDISVVATEKSFGKDFKLENNTKAPEGIATGASVGGAIGAIAAGLTAVGAITLTGGVGVLAAGPLVAAFAGAGAGATAGGVLGGLVGAGFSEQEAKLVEKNLEDGSILMGVEVEGDRADRVEEMLKASGASDVTKR